MGRITAVSRPELRYDTFADALDLLRHPLRLAATKRD